MIDLDRLRHALEVWDHGEVRIAAEWLVDLADEGGELWAEKPCEFGVDCSHHMGPRRMASGCSGGSRVRVWPEEDR